MIDIKLGGEVRQLQFSHKAIKALQSHYGAEEFNQINVNDIQHLDVIIWACLLRYNKGISLDDVEDLISDSLDEGDITYEDLSKAIEKTMKESHVGKGIEVDSKKKIVTKQKK
jgi:hypothetical protein